MDLDFALQHIPRLLKAAKLTIELTLLSLFFGIFVGIFFAILRTSKNKIFFSIIPESNDPDDYIKENGKENFLSLFRHLFR